MGMYDYLKYAIEFLFSIGLFINACLFIPQAIKIYKAKHAKEVSLLTFSGFNAIQFLAVLYGFIQNDIILIIGYGLAFIGCGIVTALVIYYNYCRNAN